MTIILNYRDYAIHSIILLYVYYEKCILLHRLDNIYITKTKDKRFIY